MVYLLSRTMVFRRDGPVGGLFPWCSPASNTGGREAACTTIKRRLKIEDVVIEPAEGQPFHRPTFRGVF